MSDLTERLRNHDETCDAECFLRDIPDIIAALDAQPVGGIETRCPLVGVHEHAFRGPHRFREWEPQP